MNERLKTLNFVAKKVVPKNIFRKIKKIKEDDERIVLLNHAIMSNLDLKLHRIEMISKDLEKKEMDVFHIFSKTNLLKAKIKYYNMTHHKIDFIKVMKLFEEIEKDLDSL